MKPVAIVIPWFGANLPGGAEQQAFQLATRLAARGNAVEVLTTCNRSFQDDWSLNHYNAGLTTEQGLRVRRFPVEARDGVAFDEVNAKLLAFDRRALRAGVSPLTHAEARTFSDENIKSSALLEHLRAARDDYHAFVFLPYMFAPATLGVPLVAERAYLEPCLHDEAAAYLTQTAAMFRVASRLLFNSDGEFELALRLYGPGIYTRSTIVGPGVERTAYTAAQLSTEMPPQLRDVPFVLYLGRRDATKNVDLLVQAFKQFKTAHVNSELQLVLAGPGAESFAAAGVQDLGLVSEQVKAALLANALVLVQPSYHESFSRALMEAWAMGRPVAAHRDCLATANVVEGARGGWLAANEGEWADLFARIAAAPDAELHELGARGRAYADKHADWEKAIARYEELLGLNSEPDSQSRGLAKRTGGELDKERGKLAFAAAGLSQPQSRAIHQLMPDIVYGDAISNQALAIRDYLRVRGHDSDIFVKRCATEMSDEARLFDERQPASNDALIYHHSIGSELTRFAVAHGGPKCLVYHNVTPAEFYAPFRPGFAWMLETGRAHLKRLAPNFPLAVGDSAFNAAELAACGFHSPGVLPIIVNPDRWNFVPDAELMARLQDRHTNVLFVGRIAPNKKQDRLIEAFAEYLRLVPHARLVIAGEGHASDPYFQHVRDTIERFKLSAQVELSGQIDDAKLLACYRTAHLYWSFSEHEGFGVPLIEAMWCDVPVLALDATAVSEAVGGAGVLFARDESLSQVAKRARQLTCDPETRRAVVDAQRRRRLDFMPETIAPTLDKLINQLTSQAINHSSPDKERRVKAS